MKALMVIRRSVIMNLLITILFLGSLDAQASKTKPNVLIMLTDDQGYGDLQSHGNPHLSTPNIEKIGLEGIEMTHFFSYPNCSASRAAILTGRYPYRTGVTGVTQVDHFMNTSEVTIAEVLQDAGYVTGIFGKWHLGDNTPMRPQDQGFDEILVHKGGGIGQDAGPIGNTYFDPVLEHNGQSEKFNGYCDDVFTDAAIEFISTNKDRPFFTYLATNLPHFPLQAPDHKAQKFREKGLHEDNALTFGMIENIDDNVGRVMDHLNKLGILDNTLVIFLSDNGPRHRRSKNDVYPGRWVSNLRGTKTSVYECGTRVPFFVKVPGESDGNVKLDRMGTVIDIMPTVLDFCDIENVHLNMDGISLLPLWRQEVTELPERVFFTQMHYGPTVFKYMHFAVRGQEYKLVSPHDDPHHILYQPQDRELEDVLSSLELYNVQDDPSERINLASKHPEIVENLLAKYELWFDEVTEERDAKGIQRIHLGSAAQPHVNLSKFDWGGPRVISENKLGHWRVNTEEGTYDVKLILPALDEDGIAYLKYNDIMHSQPFAIDQKEVTFSNVQLPKASGNFHAYFKVDRLAEGPLFVDIIRKDL